MDRCRERERKEDEARCDCCDQMVPRSELRPLSRRDSNGMDIDVDACAECRGEDEVFDAGY